MSTHTAPLKAESSKAEPPPLPANAYCPTCGQVLPPLQIQEYPKVMYKSVPKPIAKDKEEEEQPETIVVADSEEQKKKEAEGYSTEVPKPKEPAKKAEPLKHDEKPASGASTIHEHNKKS